MRKHRYPSRRKSPIKHHVKSHRREGFPVHSFERGKGTKPAVRSFVTKRRISKPTGVKAWTINFKYSSKPNDGESIVVFAPANDYMRALDEAFEEKKDPRNAIEISIVDPSIGEVLKVMGEGLKKLPSIGAKYAVKGGHAAKLAAIKAKPYVKSGLRVGGRVVKVTGKFAATEAVRGLKGAGERLKVAALVRQSYSKSRTIRVHARSRLLKYYPHVYNVCDFSKDKPLVSRPPPGITITFKPEISPKMTQKLVKARTPAQIRSIVRTEIKRQAKAQGAELTSQELEKRTKEWVQEKWIKKALKTEYQHYEQDMFKKEHGDALKKTGGK